MEQQVAISSDSSKKDSHGQPNKKKIKGLIYEPEDQEIVDKYEDKKLLFSEILASSKVYLTERIKDK